MLYRALSKAAEYFKAKLFELDKDDKFIITKIKSVKDEDSLNKWYAETKYFAKNKLVQADWEEWKLNHLDEFDEREILLQPNEETSAYIKRITNEIEIPNLTVQQARDGFRLAERLLEEYFGKSGAEREDLPTTKAYYSKPEFKEKHQSIRKSIMTKYEMPLEEKEFQKVEKLVKSLRPERNIVINDDSGLEEFIKEFTQKMLENQYFEN